MQPEAWSPTNSTPSADTMVPIDQPIASLVPTGATIVCTFGVVLILMAAAKPLLRTVWALP